MTVFAAPLAILLGFAFAGLALMPRGPAGSPEAGPWPSERLLLAPALGGLVLAVIAWLDVATFNGQTMLAWLASATLAAAGALRLRRMLRESGPHVLVPVACLGLLLLLVTAFPFRNHVAPPGVDAQYFAFITWLIDRGLGFPESRFWPSIAVEHRFLATGGTEALAAMVLRLGAPDAGMAHLFLSVAFVVAALLSAWPVIRRLAPDLPITVALPCLFFAFNSAFIWQYGDGSVSRVPGIAGLLLIAGLVAVSGGAKHLLATWRIPVLIGLVHGAILAVHFRYFIWAAVALGLWIAIETWRNRRERGVTHLWLIPVASAAVALPVLTPVLLNFGLLAARPEPEGIAAAAGMGTGEIWATFLRFQGHAAHLIVLAGLAVALRRRFNDPLIIFGLSAWIGIGIFLFGPVIRTVAPFTQTLIYPTMAALSDFAVPKLIFGTILAAALREWLLTRQRASLRMTCALGILLVSVIASLAALNALPIYNLQNPLLVQLSFAYFLRDLPGPFGTEFVYAALLLALAGILFGMGVYGRTERVPSLAVAALLVLFGANEVVNGRFNRGELSPSQREAYLWIRNNTDFETTLVLTASQLDIPHAVEAEAFAQTGKDGRIYDWSLPWLAIVADRAAVFSRVNYVARFSGVFPNISGKAPPLGALDRAFWRPDDPESLATMRRSGVSHIYVPDRYQPILADALAAAPEFERVFSTLSDDWPDRENVVYRLRNDVP